MLDARDIDDVASVIMYPAPGSYAKSEYSPLPDELNLYVSDENNISTGGAITGIR